MKLKKIFNLTTKELFGCVSFIDPFSFFRFHKPDIRIKRMKGYCYVFPQKNFVWHDCTQSGITRMIKVETLYWFLVWKITIVHIRNANLKIIKNKKK